MFLHFLKWEISLYSSRFGETLNLMAMFLMASSFFVLSLPRTELASDVVVAVLWLSALLILSLAQYRMFLADFENGVIEQWLFVDVALEVIILAKIIAHWLMSALPLILLVPIICLMFGAGGLSIISIIIAISLGSFAFVAIGCMAAAVSLRFANRDLLTTLPMAVPVLIFGAMASNIPFTLQGEWLVLIAYSLVVAPMACLASAALLRMSVK